MTLNNDENNKGEDAFENSPWISFPRGAQFARTTDVLFSLIFRRKANIYIGQQNKF